MVMKMIRFAVCDDEPLMARELVETLASYLKEKQITSYRTETFPDGASFLESGCDFDLVFLDIQMADPDGLETARLLRQRGYTGPLIFVTVLKECVFDAFEVEACDYLLKPLDAGRFRKTMDRALLSMEKQKSKGVLIRKGNACEVIPLSRIVYCEVQGRKIYIHQSGGKITDCYEKLENFGRRLDRRFFKCHRSFIVNLGFINGYESGQLSLSAGGNIPVSRLRERELKEALLRYMKGKEL